MAPIAIAIAGGIAAHIQALRVSIRVNVTRADKWRRSVIRRSTKAPYEVNALAVFPLGLRFTSDRKYGRSFGAHVGGRARFEAGGRELGNELFAAKDFHSWRLA